MLVLMICSRSVSKIHSFRYLSFFFSRFKIIAPFEYKIIMYIALSTLAFFPVVTPLGLMTNITSNFVKAEFLIYSLSELYSIAKTARQISAK